MSPYQKPHTFWKKFNSIVKQHEKPILNAYVTIMGACGLIITVKLIDKFTEKNNSATVNKPCNEQLNLSVEPSEDAIEGTFDEPLNEQYETASEPFETEEERIRQAMSLLGKRSGAVRRAKAQTSKSRS